MSGNVCVRASYQCACACRYACEPCGYCLDRLRDGLCVPHRRPRFVACPCWRPPRAAAAGGAAGDAKARAKKKGSQGQGNDLAFLKVADTMLPSHHAAALACLRQAGPASSVGASAHTIPDVWQVPVMKTFTLHSQIHAHMSARARTHTHTHTNTPVERGKHGVILAHQAHERIFAVHVHCEQRDIVPVCVRACVRETARARARERERQRERQRDRTRECVCVCACVLSLTATNAT